MTDPMTTAFLPDDPLMPHLLDLIALPGSEGLILAGGFGMRIKQAALEERIREGKTLISSIPAARSTQDLDLFLNMQFWLQKERGKAFRAVLDRLGYEVLTNYKNLQFGKVYDPVTDRLRIKVDLHAREPRAGEKVMFDDRRVGKGTENVIDGKRDDGVGLHGRTTPEAFAIDDIPTRIRLAGRRTDGAFVEAAVFVPHPYASLNMKIKAAHDWLRRARGEMRMKAYSEKHVFDVYLLVAMMLNDEFEECRALAAQYADNPMSMENRQNMSDLFADPDGPASLEIQRQIGGLPYGYDVFWEVLQEILSPIK